MRLSIGARLLLFASIAMVVMLPMAGWLIGKAFERSVRAGFDNRIEAYARTIAGLIEVEEGTRGLALRRVPGELRFDEVYSGWYWQVRRGARIQQTSRSLWDSSLDYSVAGDAPQSWLVLQGPREETLRATVLRLRLGGIPEVVEVVMAAPTREIDAEIAVFRRVLAVALGSMGAMLVGVFALQIRWGLAPLRRMERELGQVREGMLARLDPDLPTGLRGVAETMNEVLSHHESLLQRARATAGNLAHALKTPLATLRLRVEAPATDTSGVRRDLAQVQSIVDHHLSRAAAAGRAGGPFQRTDLRAAIGPVIDAVRGMSRDRALAIEMRFATEAEVAMDAQDLQELVGNLLENAVKWARSSVVLTIEAAEEGIRLLVDDDGPGIPDDARLRVTARGIQLDESAAGSGLGLAIVRDLCDLYRIAFGLEHGPLGGLRVRMILPRAGAMLAV